LAVYSQTKINTKLENKSILKLKLSFASLGLN
jgi:hypothetical protein